MGSLKDDFLEAKYRTLKIFHHTEEKETSLVESTANGRIYIRKRVPREQGQIYQYLMTLSHPGLVPIVEVIPGNEQYTVIEEYAAGITLEDYIKIYGGMPEKQAENYMIQLCRVLQLLHSRNIVHRDITPGNILITLDGYVKLIDFDISRVRKPDRNQDTTILGTVGFAAPEQFGFTQTDNRTDIFALGVVLNFMLTGKLPGEKRYEKPPFSNIIDTATSIDPTKRFSGVEQIEARLLQGTADARKKEGTYLRRPTTSKVEMLKTMAANHKRARQSQSEAYAIKPDTPKAVRFFKSIPGFRTGVGWKMAVAVIGYLFAVLWGYSIALTFGEQHYPFLLCILLFFMEVILPFVLFTNLGYIDRKIPGICGLEVWPARWIRIGMGSMILILGMIIGDLYTKFYG